MPPLRARSGLTLVEMIITMAIIAILASVIFASLDPPRRLNAARNARRMIDLTTMMDGLKAYQADHDGVLEHCYDDGSGEECISFVNTPGNTVQIIGESTNCPVSCPAITDNVIPAMQGYAIASDCFTAFSIDGQTLAPSQAQNTEVPPLGAYLPRVPADPRQRGQDAIDDTRYFIRFDEEIYRITLGACDSEGEGRGGGGDPEPVYLSR